tara:strand:- start:246 stop:722 length:477 start_codon:yes stop_codon:yes gene_type:complete
MAFKMKGSSLYGKLNLNRGGNANRPDGRAKSSAFQKDEEKNEFGETPEQYKQRMIDMGLRKSDAKEEIDSKENKKASKRDKATEKPGAPAIWPFKKKVKTSGAVLDREKKKKGKGMNIRTRDISKPSLSVRVFGSGKKKNKRAKRVETDPNSRKFRGH